jgi:hypothetical protein
LELYNALSGKSEEHNSLVDLMSETHEQQKEDLEYRLKDRHDEAIERVKKELGSEYEAQIEELTDTLDKECAQNLAKFKK